MARPQRLMEKTKADDDALQNQLLAALPEGEFLKIRPALEIVKLEAGDVLWQAEENRRHIFFPTTAVICLLYDSSEGVSIEVGITGSQGMVGVTTFMSEASMATRAVAYSDGNVYRMKASDVKNEFSECGDFQDICMHFTQTLIAQISQTAICNRLHSVEQQLCRFLLYVHDHQKQKSNIFLLTHEQIAQALGVRRETVSLAAAQLQEDKLIKYSRGKIKLLDRKGMENTACECYKIETALYNKVLGQYISNHG